MFDLNTPATLTWTCKEVRHERRLVSLMEAVRIAMKDLNRWEFFSAHIVTSDEVYSGDQIVEIFQRGMLAPRKYARF